MNVIVFEGLVKVCSLAGACVLVKAGQMASVRSGGNSGPLPPTQATLDMLVATSKDTDAGQLGVQGVGPHLGTWWTIGIVLGVAAVALPIALTRGRGSTEPAPPQGCPTTAPPCRR